MNIFVIGCHGNGVGSCSVVGGHSMEKIIFLWNDIKTEGHQPPCPPGSYTMHSIKESILNA